MQSSRKQSRRAASQMRRLVELRGLVATQDGDGTFVVAVSAAAAAADGAHAFLA